MISQESFQAGLRTPQPHETTTDDLLHRGVSEILPDEESLANDAKDRRLRVYLGIDPTSPHLHIGHTVPLRKLRHFQDLGHEVKLLFGTFTGKIGDPTDKTATRKRLTDDDIATNVATYSEQAARILDMSPESTNPVSIVFNDEWLGQLSFAEVVDLAANFSVQQMEERAMFQQRRADGKPIWLHEFLYPLMQGWDAVAMEVDVEIGGRDQTFNMLAGRTLVKRYLNKEKWAVATKLIEDPTGKKMGKTEGNIVNVSDWPEIKYEGIMTWPDSAIPMGFELLTTVPMEEVEQIRQLLAGDQVNPMDLKRALAYRVVSELDSVADAEYAEEEFDLVIRGKQEPRRYQEALAEVGTDIISLLVSSGLARDPEEATNLVVSRSVYVDGQSVKPSYKVMSNGQIVQVGKRSLKQRRKVVLG